MTVEIVGPFNQRALVVDGWRVPLMEAIELDGGRVALVVDNRYEYSFAAADFESAARLVATGIAVALGLPCHPSGNLNDVDREFVFRHITQPALAPRRMVALTGTDQPKEAS